MIDIDLKEHYLVTVYETHDPVTSNVAYSTPYIGRGHFTKYGSYHLLGISKKALAEMFRKNMGSLGDNGNIYFSKSSKFPRFKLKDTSYRKVSKLEDADAVAYDSTMTVSTDILFRYDPRFSTMAIFKMGRRVVMIPEKVFAWSGRTKDCIADKDRATEAARQIIAKHNVFTDTQQWYWYSPIEKLDPDDIEYLYGGEVVMVKNDDVDLILGVESGKYTNLVKDSIIEKKVGERLMQADERMLDNILSMIKSPDDSVKEMGWKMMTSSNFSTMPSLTRTIIWLYCRMMPEDSVYDTVAMQSLIKSVGLSRKSTFPNWNCHRLNDTPSNIIKDLDDRQTRLLVHMMEPMIREELQGVIDYITEACGKLNVKIRYSVDFNPETDIK